jgi:transcriptional regulator with XRE-family HTH domain
MNNATKKRTDRASGEAFQAARKAARLTQEATAQLLGVTIHAVRDWEQERWGGVPEAAFELLLLKTGQWEMKDWRPPSRVLGDGELRLKLARGGTISLRMSAKGFEEFATAIARARREET